MDVQRLRNLTTGKLHTDIGHVYEDIAAITTCEGVMTHQIPRALKSMLPYLQRVITDERCWDGEHDPTHVGEIDVPPMGPSDVEAMFKLFREMPNPLAGKDVIAVHVKGDQS